MDSDSEICLIGIFAVCFMRDYGRGNQFSKVVHDESGKDLLVYVLHLFRVEMEQPNSIFQFPERSFNVSVKSPRGLNRGSGHETISQNSNISRAV